MAHDLGSSFERLSLRSEDKASQHFRLLDLTPELIDYIITFDIEPKYKGVCLPRATTKVGHLPPITFTCKRLRAIYLRTLIEKTTYSIHSGRGHTGFRDWLNSIDLSQVSSNYSDGFDAVKKLDFPYFSRFQFNFYTGPASNLDVELMRKCENLAEVTIKWAGDELVDQHTGMKRSMDQLVQDYRLGRMLDLPSVQKVLLRQYRCSGEGMVDALGDLRHWFVESYKDKGKEVVVEMI